MKKTISICLIMILALGCVFAGSKRMTVTPKIAYDTLGFSAKMKPVSGSEYTLFNSVNGMSIGAEISYLAKTKLEIYANGSYVIPFRFYSSRRTDGRLIGSYENKKEMKETFNDFKLSGYRFHIGAFYNFFDSGLIKLGAGGGVALSGIKREGTYKTSNAKTKTEAFAAGLALKVLGNYYFNDTWSIFATVEPDINFYSKIKDAGSEKSGACLSSGVSAAVGCSYTI